MTTFEGFVLGLVQGLTEFLPVSSSGHLVIFQEFLGVKQAGITFEVMVHFGTLLSVLVVFRHDIFRILTQFTRQRTERHFTMMLFLGIIPTGLMGVFLSDIFKRFYESILTTGFMLLVTGCILFTLSRLKPGRKTEGAVTPADALIISLAQGVAIIPGISRSGSTITTALWRGLNRETAVRYSFLVSIPVILGATILEVKDMLEVGFTGFDSSIVVGTITAFFAGVVAIRWLINFLQNGKFHYFAYYCWFIGAVTIVLTLTF